MKVKQAFEERKNLNKKIDVMLKTARMREKQLAANIESKIKAQQRKMIEQVFQIMKHEISLTCEQARAIRREYVQRDAAERKLVGIIMA